jgi:Protein of unknown function (DUF3108)
VLSLPTVKIFLLFCLASLSATAAPFTAYRVGFAIFSHAGNLTISAYDEKLDGVDVMRVTTDTRSRGIVRGLYAFDNQAAVVIEKNSGRMLSVKESGADPKRTTDTEISFDYAKRIAQYTDRVRTDRTAEIPLPEGDPVDLISALVQTRDWKMQPGDKRDLLVQFGREFYPLTLKAETFEEVRTPLGTFRTLLVIPRMEKEPKGLFKKGGEIKVWISQDASNLPVKMQLKLKVGSATLLLSEYKNTQVASPASAPAK